MTAKKIGLLIGFAVIGILLTLAILAGCVSRPDYSIPLLPKVNNHPADLVLLPSGQQAAMLPTNAVNLVAVVRSFGKAAPAPIKRTLWAWQIPDWSKNVGTFGYIQDYRSSNSLYWVTYLQRATNLANPVWIQCTSNLLLSATGPMPSAWVTNDVPVYFLRSGYSWIKMPAYAP